MDKLTLRHTVKALHTLGAIGSGGALAACLVVAVSANRGAPGDFAASRLAIAAIARWLLVPSLAVVLVTGLLAIAIHRPFHDAGWAWLKALLGLTVFEATLVTAGASRQAVELAAQAGHAAELTSMLGSERNTLLLLLGLTVANVVLAIWRPRLSWRVP